LSFGPLQGANWEFGNLVYMPSSDFGPSATMTFDSMMQVHLDIKGQIGATGFGGNVVFKPRTQVPIDHAVGLTASVITISGTAFNQPACNIDREGIVFDATGGSISSIDFTVIEANGAGPPGSTACGSYGIHIKTANGNGFVLNHVKFIQLHLYKTAGLKIDIDGARNPHAVSQNIFDGFALPPSPSAPPAQLYGFWVYGTLNLFIGGISNNEGTATCGVYLEGGTTANKFVLAANLATKPTCGPGNPSQNVFF
jgi:hypothetical protein